MSKNESDATYTEPVTAYIEPETLKSLEKKAQSEDRTISSVLRILIKKYIGEKDGN